MNIGAHVSVAGGVENAVQNQLEVGGSCGQIFTHSPQVWEHTDIEDDSVTAFREQTEANLEGPWVIHSSYLVNLCTPKDDLREKSLESLGQELDAAERLDIDYVNVHLGAHTGAGVDGGLENAASAIDTLDIPDGVTLLLETDAGSGTKLGGEFDHLATVLDQSSQDLGICFDTAHAFAAGYDLSTESGVEETVAELEEVVGLENLEYIHLNDSKHDCGTHKDEHAHIGEGEIGVEGMRAFLTHPALEGVPIAVETPTEDGKSFEWNIQRARELHDSA